MFTLLTTLVIVIYETAAHSWLHCVDYDPTALLTVGKIDSSFCRVWPRGISPTAPFGEDRGYDYRPTDLRPCRDQYAGRMATYRPGQRIRLLWPAKNHVAASCTNPNIPRGKLQLYAYPVMNATQPDPTFTSWTNALHLIYDFDASGKGFQNCPDFCPQMDRVPCFGDLTFPSNLRSGIYKMIWVWNFNINEWFTHCFDVTISGTTKAPTRTPTAKAPTAKAPTAKAPTAVCSQAYQQCGGQGWTGSRCCVSGTTCVFQNVHYSQCRP